MLGNNHRARFLSHDKMGTALAQFNEAKAFQGAGRRNAADITRQFHASASTGSSEKCKRTRLGRRPDSK